MKTIILVLFLFSAVLADTDGVSEYTTAQTWGYGSLAGIGIICVGLFAALTVIGIRQCISEKTFKIIKNVLHGIGCGAVVGDAVAHLLPMAFGDAHTNSNIVALIIILAIGFFIILDRVFSRCGVNHENESDIEPVGEDAEERRIAN